MWFTKKSFQMKYGVSGGGTGVSLPEDPESERGKEEKGTGGWGVRHRVV